MQELLSKDMKRFNYLANEIDYAYHEAALKLHLSDSAMLILYAICSGGKEYYPLCNIYNLSGISKQTLNSALRKLESEDIVYLKLSGKKKKLIYLTEKGKDVVSSTVVRLIEIENMIFNSWTKDEQNIYLELTQRYLSDFKEKIKYL